MFRRSPFPMPTIMDRDTLRRVAWLSRIAADDNELDGYGHHFDRLLEFVADLESAPTEGVKPMAHPLDMVQRLRPDQVSEDDEREQLQDGAPLTEDGLYLVPKVIE